MRSLSQSELLGPVAQAELLAPPIRRTYRWGRPRRPERSDRPRLRGVRADAAAHTYLERALEGGHWHALEGLWIIGWAQGIPRASFERVLARFELETERRGFLEEYFVRLAPAIDRSALAEHERAVLAGLEALAAGDGERWPW